MEQNGIDDVFQELLCDDEEVVQIIERSLRPRQFRHWVNIFIKWDDKEFLIAPQYSAYTQHVKDV